ncbi:MAG TPA: cytochrome c biogenesis protein ResB [Verrucomicrobiae bacterium]|nr:cytochrome c biogenesis protein ResB [Verrucomicrobiae bacterium]
MLTRLYNFFSSVKLAVLLLALGLILVFWGTLAQVKLGLYQAQNDFFRSWFIYWQPQGSGLRIPIFPGSYLVGFLLLINLFTAHLRYYRKGWKHFGIALLHIGVVLMLVGQFATDMLSVESYMRIREGAASNYSESNGRWELAVVDTTDAKDDKVVAVPAGLLVNGETIQNPELPFKLKVLAYHLNSTLSGKQADGLEPVEAENTASMQIWWRGLPKETRMNYRDIPSVLVELTEPGGKVRKMLVSGHMNSQALTVGGRNLKMDLRPERYYKPYYLYLVDFRFDRYPGTEIPKNYSSRVRVVRPESGEDREVTIRMNEPLRYAGKTFFQSSFDEVDEKGTVLQVVDNPGWLTPYFACILVAVGMSWQFLVHLIGFATKRRTATT